jgi:hypothetical protein
MIALFGFFAILFIIVALPLYLTGCDPTLMPLCPAYYVSAGYVNAIMNYDPGPISDGCSGDIYFGYAQVQLKDQSNCRMYVIQGKCDADSATASAQKQFQMGQNTTVYIPKLADTSWPFLCYQTGKYTKDLAIAGVVFFVLAALCIIIPIFLCVWGTWFLPVPGAPPHSQSQQPGQHSSDPSGAIGLAAPAAPIVPAESTKTPPELEQGQGKGEEFMSVNP